MFGEKDLSSNNHCVRDESSQSKLSRLFQNKESPVEKMSFSQKVLIFSENQRWVLMEVTLYLDLPRTHPYLCENPKLGFVSEKEFPGKTYKGKEVADSENSNQDEKWVERDFLNLSESKGLYPMSLSLTASNALQNGDPSTQHRSRPSRTALTRNSTENYEYSVGKDDQIWCGGEGTNGSVHSRFRPMVMELLWPVWCSGGFSMMQQQELPDETLELTKEYLRNLIATPERKEELVGLQSRLERRSDLTKETLSKCCKGQLEILVAVKMGLKSFLSGKLGRLRCLFPWCHVACGIQRNLIKPGPIKGPSGITECNFIAWDRPCFKCSGQGAAHQSDELCNRLQNKAMSTSDACNIILQFFNHIDGLADFPLTSGACSKELTATQVDLGKDESSAIRVLLVRSSCFTERALQAGTIYLRTTSVRKISNLLA
ncbi:Zinc finger protein 4 [Hibiscus syriacus]|uniref:Zinc finger protein 4 n=1 Tax=Hibiscus syriacus TaxID=106335 RepID=A0A6A2ZFY1_HIBSY|nr:Zinc finger protein 4 [Hibiscus syriacus]